MEKHGLIFAGLTFKVPIRWLDSLPQGHLLAPSTVFQPRSEGRGPSALLGPLWFRAFCTGYTYWL